MAFSTSHPFSSKMTRDGEDARSTPCSSQEDDRQSMAERLARLRGTSSVHGTAGSHDRRRSLRRSHSRTATGKCALWAQSMDVTMPISRRSTLPESRLRPAGTADTHEPGPPRPLVTGLIEPATTRDEVVAAVIRSW